MPGRQQDPRTPEMQTPELQTPELQTIGYEGCTVDGVVKTLS